ncbi:MAG TPA: HEAT repeat domain-containing protein [Pyrinomonadaceae bacterium]|nr:HEAT repeat domain-containing protein [Pyrinomonadaceae bacterium]
MRLTSPSASLVLMFLLACSSSACAKNAAVVAGVESGAQDRAGVSPQSFVQVTEGSDLASKLEAAARRARADNVRTPYWTVYTFDVRPGVAVDPGGGSFHGSMNSYGGLHVFSGTNAAGVTVETRNLGLFLLRDAGNATVKRMEIYNLDRQREYAGFPVYSIGRAGNEESINFLRGIAESGPASAADKPGLLVERAALAIALHDDARVAQVLKNFVRTSQHQRVRSASVYWLGQAGGETQFLADLVRSNSETVQLRKSAAHAIGESRDRAALSTLQSLFDAVAEREIRKAIVHSASNNEDKQAALAFILRVAKSDTEREVRKAAVHSLGDLGGGDAVIDELMKIYSSDRDIEVRKTVLHALEDSKSQRAEAKLFEIARDASQPAELRKHAIHRLGDRKTETVVAELIRLYDTDRTRDVRRQILHALAESKSERAENKLFEIARSADDPDMRRKAIHHIGERVGRRSLELLRETVESSSADAQVQMQAVHAISERPAEEAVPLLIKIAKTHPNQQVRRAAVHQLGESGDPRALEFFREVLSSKQ